VRGTPLDAGRARVSLLLQGVLRGLRTGAKDQESDSPGQEDVFVRKQQHLGTDKYREDRDECQAEKKKKKKKKKKNEVRATSYGSTEARNLATSSESY
jgi:hypothetical protein